MLQDMECRCGSDMGKTHDVGEWSPASESTIGAATTRSRASDENFTMRDHSVQSGHANAGTIEKVECIHCEKVIFHNAIGVLSRCVDIRMNAPSTRGMGVVIAKPTVKALEILFAQCNLDWSMFPALLSPGIA
ncbi:hypothetical protein NL676_018935 [Syzygium grande]|nr:hypothetical protein NL676_018935 [Syzygium grande]